MEEKGPVVEVDGQGHVNHVVLGPVGSTLSILCITKDDREYYFSLEDPLVAC